MNLFKTIALCSSLMLLAYALKGMESESEVQVKEQDLYCEMVSLHLDDKTLGWPDYKGIYDSVCIPKYRMTDI